MNTERTSAQIEAGNKWVGERIQRQAEADKKLISFLRDNPGSESELIYHGCGVGVSRGRFLTWKRIDGKVKWFVNEEKLRRYLS